MEPPARTQVPRAVPALLAVQVALLVAFAASTVLRTGSGYVELYDGWLGNTVLGLPAVVCLVRAATVRADRALFLLLGLAAAAFTTGSLMFSLWLQYLDPVPYPSWSDAAWLVTYVSLVGAVGCAARGHLSGLQSAVWLDGLVGGLGAAALGSALGLRHLWSSQAGDLAALVVNAAYPLADLLLVVLVVGVFALTGGRPGAPWAWLGSGLVCFALADTVYLVRMAEDVYAAGTPLDVLWALGLTLLSVPACLRRPSARPARADGAAVLVVPLVFSVLAVAVLAVASRTRMPVYVVALAVGTLLVALVRTAVGFQSARAVRESRRQARTDELTGLPNRRAFSEHLAGRAGGEAVAVLLLDLDRFKEVNDSLGHHVGDELLSQIGPRLAGLLRPGDLLARLGGDEFGAVLDGADEPLAVHVAQRLVAALAEPFLLDGVSLHIGGSVGIALAPDHAPDAAALLQRADVAMYEAKSRGTYVSVYDPDRDVHSRDRLRTIEQLREALDTDQVVVHYQPKCDVGSGEVVGVEALVRWQHPERGLLYPDAFLPLVEQTGLMPALTLAVLGQAVAQCRQWRLDGLDLSVAVNLSASNLLDDRLPEQVARLLTRHEVPASALELEITENTLMVDPVRATATLHALRDLGVGLSVDDYGTGYCSLTYLRNLPVDELKLDRSFVMTLTAGSRDAAIVRSTVQLAHALGLRMVAEGVENDTALDVLHQLHCDLAQGYHLSRPLPADALTSWLRQRPTRRTELSAPVLSAPMLSAPMLTAPMLTAPVLSAPTLAAQVPDPPLPRPAT